MKKRFSDEFFFNRRVHKVGAKNAKLTLSIKALCDLCLESLRPLRLIVFILSCFWSYSAYSQTNCTVPLPPVLTSVSVQNEKDITELKWTLSPSSGVAGYVIRTYKIDDGQPRGDRFITISDSTATSFSYSTLSSKYFFTEYVVEAYRLPIIIGGDSCFSIFSNVLSTIFAEASIDTCNEKIVVSWNKYNSIPKKVTSYSILMSVNGGNFIDAANPGPEKNSDTLNYITTNAKYCFVVRANLEDGTFSTSNKACPLPGVCTDSPEIPTDPPDEPTDSPEIITVPNVFTPNKDFVNDFFRPVLSFSPLDYHLVISDRRGNILFKTEEYDKEWDGSGKGNGVYLWFLKVTTPSGKSISKTGTVTIINNTK